ncbi:MAG: DNA repair protein RecO [Bacteroidia bacterium]
MLHTMRGIVLRTIRYNDKAVIANIYTELFGLQGYLIHTGKNKKSALLQPLTCLEITVEHKTNKSLQRIKEATCSPQFSDIPYNTAKSSLAIFIAEVFYRSVKEEESNPALFNFLLSAILLLDEEQNSCSNFHLAFLVQLSSYLGFFPGNEYSETESLFDLEEGIFFSGKPAHANFIAGETAHCFAQLMNSSLNEHATIPIQKSHRKELLSALMNYYRMHLQGMSEVRSHKVLEEVMG